MKKIKKFWAGLLALLALTTGCSQDEFTPEQGTGTPATRQVYVELEAGRDEQQLRMVYGVKDDGSGATNGLQMAEKDLNIRVAVRRGTGAPVIQNLVFNKVQGENRATYAGQISIPSDGSGDYQISAVLMSEVGGHTYATVAPDNANLVSFNAGSLQLKPANSEGKIDVPVPYMAQWMPAPLNSSGTVMQPVHLVFQPQGTVLRVRFKSELSDAVSFKAVSVLRPRSLRAITMDFSGEQLIPNVSTLVGDLSWESAITVAPGATSDWYYTWQQPYNGWQSSEPTYYSILGKYRYALNKNIPNGSASLTIVLKNEEHRASFLDVYNWGEISDLPEPRNPLSYLAPQVVKNDFTSFVEGVARTTQNDVAFMTHSDAMARFSSPVPMTLPGGVQKNFSIPTGDEMKVLTPSNQRMEGLPYVPELVNFSRATNYLNVVDRSVKIGSITKDYQSDFRNFGGAQKTVTYALRFKDANNFFRTAYRYQFVIETPSNAAYIKIQAYLLGPDNSKIPNGIEDVAKESFWTGLSTSDAKYAERIYPMYGHYELNADAPGSLNWFMNLRSREDELRINDMYRLHSVQLYRDKLVFATGVPSYRMPYLLIER